MGNYRARRPGFLQGWQIDVADLMFQGKTDEEIIMKIWPKTEPNQMQNKRYRLRNLRRDEKFQEYYRSIITEWSVHNVGKALHKLSDQIDSEKPWVANKAANDVLLHSKALMTGADDNTVVVKIEGMPEMGSPEDE